MKKMALLAGMSIGALLLLINPPIQSTDADQPVAADAPAATAAAPDEGLAACTAEARKRFHVQRTFPNETPPAATINGWYLRIGQCADGWVADGFFLVKVEADGVVLRKGELLVRVPVHTVAAKAYPTTRPATVTEDAATDIAATGRKMFVVERTFPDETPRAAKINGWYQRVGQCLDGRIDDGYFLRRVATNYVVIESQGIWFRVYLKGYQPPVRTAVRPEPAVTAPTQSTPADAEAVPPAQAVASSEGPATPEPVILSDSRDAQPVETPGDPEQPKGTKPEPAPIAIIKSDSEEPLGDGDVEGETPYDGPNNVPDASAPAALADDSDTLDVDNPLADGVDETDDAAPVAAVEESLEDSPVDAVDLTDEMPLAPAPQVAPVGDTPATPDAPGSLDAPIPAPEPADEAPKAKSLSQTGQSMTQTARAFEQRLLRKLPDDRPVDFDTLLEMVMPTRTAPATPAVSPSKVLPAGEVAGVTQLGPESSKPVPLRRFVWRPAGPRSTKDLCPDTFADVVDLVKDLAAAARTERDKAQPVDATEPPSLTGSQPTRTASVPEPTGLEALEGLLEDEE